jgi:hypothetical protein
MPHSVASLQRKLEHQSDAFLYDLRIKLWRNDRRAFRKFNDAVIDLKDAPPDVVYKTINTCLKHYPEFCGRVVGFYPDGRLKLKDTPPPPAVAPIQSVRFFADDILACLIPFLPFPIIGRLAKTCKWMNTHITSDMVEQELKCARERFGKASIIVEEPSNRHMLRIYNTEDEMLMIGRLSAGSSICILKTQDSRTFIGISHDMGPGPVGRFAVLSDVITHAIAAGPDAPSVWFKRTAFAHQTHASIALTFIMIRDGDPYGAHCCMQFEEFVQ